MECDLGRLHLAIEAANARISEQNRFIAELAGFDIPEARPEQKAPSSPEELDDRFREAMAGLGGRRVELPPPDAE